MHIVGYTYKMAIVTQFIKIELEIEKEDKKQEL